jgi:hypothetical protein
MRLSLRTMALATLMLVGVSLGFGVKPAQAQYPVGPYGAGYYGSPTGAYGYGYVAPGYNNGYYGGGNGIYGGNVRSWSPLYQPPRFGFGMRRYWGPRARPYTIVPPSI